MSELYLGFTKDCYHDWRHTRRYAARRGKDCHISFTDFKDQRIAEIQKYKRLITSHQSPVKTGA